MHRHAAPRHTVTKPCVLSGSLVTCTMAPCVLQGQDVGTGLLTYPVLMAADVLLYQVALIPCLQLQTWPPAPDHDTCKVQPCPTSSHSVIACSSGVAFSHMPCAMSS